MASNHRIVFGLMFALTCFGSACGDVGGPVVGKDTDNLHGSGNYLSGNCGSTVVSDYNTYVLRCKYVTSESDIAQCKSTAQSFIQKYPNVNCAAQASDVNSVNASTVQITQSK